MLIEVFSGTQTTVVVREVSTESARLRRSRLEFSSFLRDLRRSSIRSKLCLLRGYARIGFRQGYADSAEQDANLGKNVLDSRSAKRGDSRSYQEFLMYRGQAPVLRRSSSWGLSLSSSGDAMQFSQLQLTSIGLKFRFGRKCTLLFDGLLLAFWTDIWYAFGRRMKIWSNAGLRMM